MSEEAEPTPDIMVSFHVGSMKEHAQQLAKFLEEKGFSVWICVDMAAGEEFRKAISITAATCKAFIPLINQKWADSNECAFEFNIALRSNLTKRTPHIFPVVIGGFNWIDPVKYSIVNGLISSTNVAVLEDDKWDPAFNSLVASLNKVHIAGTGSKKEKTKDSLPKSASEWTVDHVTFWLTTLGLGEHGPTFTSCTIDGRELLELTDEVMTNDLKISNKFHRKKILERRAEYVAPPPAAAAPSKPAAAAPSKPAASKPAAASKPTVSPPPPQKTTSSSSPTLSRGLSDQAYQEPSFGNMGGGGFGNMGGAGFGNMGGMGMGMPGMGMPGMGMFGNQFGAQQNPQAGRGNNNPPADPDDEFSLF